MADKLWKSTRILAPMVRCGTLPLRLLALRYGADTVYSEEIVDKRLIQCQRVVNEQLDTIDFITGQRGNTQLVFRTSRDKERGRCVFQMGTATPELAVQAARVVADDVDAVDVNMGCPKHFSVHSGMGVALTHDSDRACSIIRALRAALKIPVSCKIRLRDTTAETISLVRALEAAGAQAIGVHARTASERPHDQPHWDQLKEIVEAVSVPVLVNGDVWGPQQAEELLQLSGCTSSMSARGALKNCKSCFESNVEIAQKIENDPASLIEVIRDYVKLSIDYDNHGKNTKYVVQYMLKMNNRLGTPFGTSVSSGKIRTLQDIARVCGVEEYYQEDAKKKEEERRGREAVGGGGGGGGTGDGLLAGRAYDDDYFYARPKKRSKISNAPNMILPPNFKKILLEWGNKQKELPRKQQCPQYQHLGQEPAFQHFDDVASTSQAMAYRACVHVAGQKFLGGWGKSKKIATSKAAHVAVEKLGIFGMIPG